MRSKILRVSGLVALAMAILIVVVVGHWRKPHQVTVKAYFGNVGGLRQGAKVRIAGVDIGSVDSVRVRPELGQEPVEVVMTSNPPYEIKIPRDSTVSLETAGVLGETYAEINTAYASAPPLGPNAVLKTEPTEQMTTQQFLEFVSKILEKKNCNCGVQNEKAERTPAAVRTEK